MNNCAFVGRLASDPVIKELNNTHLVNFTLAIEEHRRDKDGTKRKRVDFLDFEAWDTGATTIGKYCQKGDEIAVLASARQDKWTDKEGNRRSKIKFRVNKFKLFNYNNSEKNSEKEETTAKVSASESDAPF